MRSVVVVLPASICAAIPMLRVRSIVYFRVGEFTDLFSTTACIYPENKNAPMFLVRGANIKISLPAKMRKGLIGLRHLMHLITLSDGVALALERIHNFRRQ